MHTTLHQYLRTSHDDAWFHGTRTEFSSFRVGDASANPGFNMDDTGLGVFLTDNLTMAKQFAGMIYYDTDAEGYVADPEDNGVGRVLTVKVKASRPYLAGEGEHGLHAYASAIEDFGGVPGFRGWLVDRGYDSVLIKDLDDHYYGDGTYNILCVLDPSDAQIVGRSSEGVSVMSVTMKHYLSEAGKTTMTFWHGGDLDDIDDDLSHRGGRWEFGPGLYLTTQYDVVQKYARGSRKLYRITVERGRELDDEWFERDTVDAFVDAHVVRARRKDVNASLDRVQRDGRVNGDAFLNVLINNNAIRNTDTSKLRRFFVANGVDYHMVDNAFGWGERMMVLFDTSKIVDVTRVKPGERFDDWNLPKTWSVSEASNGDAFREALGRSMLDRGMTLRDDGFGDTVYAGDKEVGELRLSEENGYAVVEMIYVYEERAGHGTSIYEAVIDAALDSGMKGLFSPAFDISSGQQRSPAATGLLLKLAEGRGRVVAIDESRIDIDEDEDDDMPHYGPPYYDIFITRKKTESPAPVTESATRRDYLRWKRANVSYRGMRDRYDTEGNGGMAILGQGLYTAALSNRAMARQYGKVYLAVNARPKNPKRFNTLNDWQIWAGSNKVNGEISRQMQDMGYDGVEIVGREYVNYSPDEVLYFENEWELEDYYERNYDRLSEGVSVEPVMPVMPEFWYHGTNEEFDSFEDKRGRNFEQSTLGTYFTQYEHPSPYGSTAKEYAEMAVAANGGRPFIYKCRLRMDDPLVLDSSGWYSSNTMIDKNRSDIGRWVGDHDAVVAYNPDEEFRWQDFIAVVRDPSSIEIVERYVWDEDKYREGGGGAKHT